MFSLAATISGLHLVIWFIAVVLDTGLVGVYPVCGGILEDPITQASGLPTVLDWERTQGHMRADNDGWNFGERNVSCLSTEQAENLREISFSIGGLLGWMRTEWTEVQFQEESINPIEKRVAWFLRWP